MTNSAQLIDRDELERAFLELSVEHRAVLVLTHYVGLPAPEAARILGIPPGTVASRLHYGARAMRAALGRHRRDAGHDPGARTMNESMDQRVRRLAARGPRARYLARAWSARSRRLVASASGPGGPSPKGGSRCN